MFKNKGYQHPNCDRCGVEQKPTLLKIIHDKDRKPRMVCLDCAEIIKEEIENQNQKK